MHALRLICIISLMAILSACGGEAPVEWGYTGPGAPENWASLSPDFAACANGKQQSPIDITGYQPGGPGPISFSYSSRRGNPPQRRQTGPRGLRSLATLPCSEGREFKLKSAHFHSPSEHLVDGESFAAELHMVHADSDGRLAVVGLLFTLGEPSPVAQSILDAAPPPDGTANASIPLTNALPTDLSYYRYDDSKTTPPCDEPVDWHVLRQPMTISQEQVEGLLSLSGGPNNRPVQPDRRPRHYNRRRALVRELREWGLYGPLRNHVAGDQGAGCGEHATRPVSDPDLRVLHLPLTAFTL